MEPINDKVYNKALDIINNNIENALDLAMKTYDEPVTGRTHIDTHPALKHDIPEGYAHVQTDFGPISGGTPVSERTILCMDGTRINLPKETNGY